MLKNDICNWSAKCTYIDLITYMNRKGVVHNHLNNCHAWLTMIVCTFRMALHIGCTTTYYVDKCYSKVGSVLILNLMHTNNNLTNNWRNNWWSIIDALEQSSKNSCRIGDLKDQTDCKWVQVISLIIQDQFYTIKNLQRSPIP